MKMGTIIGALIAAIIGFLTGFLALLQQDGVNGIADISEIAWYVLGAGTAIAFLKDFQAINTRKVIAKIAGTGAGP